MSVLTKLPEFSVMETGQPLCVEKALFSYMKMF